jgi:hypothetical protein
MICIYDDDIYHVLYIYCKYPYYYMAIIMIRYDIMSRFIFKSYVASVQLRGSQGARGAGTGQRGLLAAEGPLVTAGDPMMNRVDFLILLSVIRL